MGFKLNVTEPVNFNSPVEMYKDYKKRKIKGTLDYQSEMINSYMTNGYTKSDVALELPTGSGKTLIGLLIAEYRRRKNSEKVVFVCPNNQLVHQVVEMSNNHYDIKATAFYGKKRDFDPVAVAKYNTAQTIAVTNYSSIFNTNSFFSDADVLIFDDAHGAENYIANNWSLNISRNEHTDLFVSLIQYFRSTIGETSYNLIAEDDPNVNELQWIDKIPQSKLIDAEDQITPILDEYAEDNNLSFPWSNIKGHLKACSMFISWGNILIRPLIPPTQTCNAFKNATQRLYMSATLGQSGELERLFGVEKINRLPMVEKWDKKSIGRRFFMFPNASFKEEQNKEIYLGIKHLSKRNLILAQDDVMVNKIREYYSDLSTEVLTSKDIEKSKEKFVNSEDAVTILANRYDGIDFAGDSCNVLIVANMPNATHLQEKFLSKKMAASLLFNERIKTRIIQAIGRCTRSDEDYSAVCIFGNDLENELVSPKKLKTFPAELRSELHFGYTQSMDKGNVEEFLELLQLFLEQGDAWSGAENEIISTRDKYISDQDQIIVEGSEDLQDCVKYEVKYQYAMWREDFEEALKLTGKILSTLNVPALKGYKAYWHYLAGTVAYELYRQGQSSYRAVAKEHFKNASRATHSISWFAKIIQEEQQETIKLNNTYMFDCLERIEELFVNKRFHNSKIFEKKVAETLRFLRSQDGTEFERGHLALGELLGYIAENAKGDAEPDPWWIINDTICVVSEDKIYQSSSKSIPATHARQADGHDNWIKTNVKSLKRDAEIIKIMLTNSTCIGPSAAVHGEEVWWVNRDEFVSWAVKALDALRTIKTQFGSQGSLLWREDAERVFKENKVTPEDFLAFIKKKKLK